MITFDAARRNQCTVRRQRTSTPMQALVLLNDPQFVEASRKIAERLLREGGETLEERITLAYLLLTSRPPHPRETNILTKLYHEQRDNFLQHPEEAQALLAIGDAPYDRRMAPPDLAALTLLVNTLMNYEEVTTKR